MAGDWGELPEGEPCPFDFPRPDRTDTWDRIATLSVSSLYLENNRNYPGYCVLIFDPRHATVPDDLSENEWLAWCRDLHASQAAVAEVVSPDHMNLAALGNVVPHLHWHIIPRFKNDPRWGQPVWTTTRAEFSASPFSDQERQQLVSKLRESVASMGQIPR